MTHYVIAEVDLKDDSWVPEYVKNVAMLVEQHGGRYLARTPQVEKVEGERKAPHLCAIIEFPSREAAQTFYASAEYQPYLRTRLEGASSNLLLVAGERFGEG